MQRVTILSSILVVGILIVSAQAHATVHNGTIAGDEAQATSCSVGSTSQLLGTVTYDDVSGVFTWSFTYGDNAPAFDNGALFAGGTPTVAHFHGPAAPGATAGTRVTVSSATPSAGSTTISASFGAELLDELWYVNVHSSNCGGGELRGQVLFPSAAVPSVSGGAIVALAVLLLGTAWFGLRGSGSREGSVA